MNYELLPLGDACIISARWWDLMAESDQLV